ncbi:MAG: Ig-like domain-containing protein [Pirellulaceae bacterium]
MLSSPAATDLTIDYLVSGTATPNEDYESLTGSTTVLAGATSAVINISVYDDADLESGESVTLTIQSGSSYTLGAASQATATILDNDTPLAAEIAATTASTGEGGGAPAQVTISLSSAAPAALTVFYTVSGTASVGDYTALSGQAIFGMGQTSATVDISAVDDVNLESTESVQFTLASGAGYSIGAVDQAFVTITDDDTVAPKATVAASTSHAYEFGVIAGQFTISLPGVTSSDMSVNYTISGSATTGDDYDALSGSATIPAGQASVDIQVVPVDDGVSESLESVVLTLDAGSDYALGSTTSATVTIGDVPLFLAVDAGADATIGEGGSLDQTGAFSDPGGAAWTATVDYGDGGNPTSLALNPDGSFTLDHLYASEGTFTATVVVVSEDNRTAANSLVVTVVNVAPTISLESNITIASGDAFVVGGDFVDPGLDTWTATVDYGDGYGAEPLTLNSDKTFTLDYLYSSTGTFTVTVAVSDGDGGAGTASLIVKVDEPPVLDLDSDDSSDEYGDGFKNTFVEDGGPVEIADGDALITDVDGGDLTWLTAKLTNPWNLSDESLSADTAGTNIQASYAGGALTLTGADTQANYQQVLRTLRYENLAAGPTAIDRVVLISVGNDVVTSNTVTSTVSIQTVNDPPTAADSSVFVGRNTSTTLELGDDGDPESVQQLTLTVLSGPSHGSLGNFNAAAGYVWYLPESGYVGDDSITYQLTDEGGLTSDVVTMSLSIIPANNAPTGDAQGVSTAEETGLSITLTGDDGEETAEQTLTFAIVEPPAHGVLSGFDGATGQVVYTPDVGYVGDDVFAFVVTDDATVGWETLTSDPATVTVTVTPVNDAPHAADQSVGVGLETATTISLGDDGDAEVEQALTLNVLGAPAHGVLGALDAVTGKIVYTPDAGYTGPDSFTYTLTDDAAAGAPSALTSSAATVTIEVSSAPIATAASVSTTEDGPLAITLVGDDGDPNVTKDLVFTLVRLPEHGAISGFDPATGELLYSPDANFNGADSFEFTVGYVTAAGVAVASSPVVVDILVAPVNDRPFENTPNVLIAKDSAAVLLLGDDNDPEVQQQLTLTIITAPQYGALSGFDPITGKATYTPQAGYVGADSFSFTLTDDAAAGDEAALVSEESIATITVVELPTADDQSRTVYEDASHALTLTAQPGDASHALRYMIVSYPGHGEITSFNDATGAVVYQPDDEFQGEDSLQFAAYEVDADGYPTGLPSLPATIAFTVNAVNDTPLAGALETATGREMPLEITLTGDDGDTEVEQTLSFSILDEPLHGVISEFDPATGYLVYTPESGYVGPDNFTFTVTDDATAGGPAVDSEPATVDITIAAPPVAVSANVSAVEDTPLDLVISGAAGDPNQSSHLKYIFVTYPEHGTLTAFDPLTGELKYTPDADFAGVDSFVFAVTDDLAGPGLALTSQPATVDITIAEVNDAPRVGDFAVDVPKGIDVALTLGRDPEAQTLTLDVLAAPSHGALTGFDADTGQVTYTPDSGYSGSDSFTYTLTDASGLTSSLATAAISVLEVNDAPTADEQSLSTSEDASVAFTLSGDDGDDDVVQTLTYEIVTIPAHGQILNFDPATGTGQYVPDPGFNGVDTITFVVHDVDENAAVSGVDGATSEPATLTITVGAANNAPVAEPLDVAIPEDQPVKLQLSADDGDDELEQSLTFVIVDAPLHGSISDLDASTGRLTYTPDANYNGADSFTYYVLDDATAGGAALASSTQTVAITIAADDHAVAAVSQGVRTEEDQPLTILLGGIGSPDAVTDLTFAVSAAPASGTISYFNPTTGEVVYTPNSGFTGTDSFAFTITDNDAGGAVSTASVLIDVKPVGAAPAAVNDDVTVRASDGQILLDVLGNDSYSSASGVTLVGVSTPATGTAAIVAGTPGAPGPEGRDRILFTPAPGQSGAVSFNYTVEDGSGNQSTAAVQATVAADGAQPTDGAVSLGGVDFDPAPDSTFVPPVSGSLMTHRTVGGTIVLTWTDPLGNEFSGAGTQSRDALIVSSRFDNGDWMYTEIVDWSYDATAGDAHAWGGYSYTLLTGSVAGADYFLLMFNASDDYDTSTEYSDGDEISGSKTSITSDGNQQTRLFMLKVANVAGTIFNAQYSQTARSNYDSKVEYWRPTSGGNLSGMVNSHGSTLDTWNMNVTRSLGGGGAWTATGSATGMGYANDQSNDSFTGTYTVDVISGTVNGGGVNTNRLNYNMTGTLASDLTWDVSGAGSLSSRGNTWSQFSGSGTYTRNVSDQTGFSNVTGTAKENGSSRNTSNASADISLFANGWGVTEASASNSSVSRSFYAFFGSGSYNKSESANGASWNINGNSIEFGGRIQSDQQSAQAEYSDGVWSASGSGSGSSNHMEFSFFWGSGTYSQVLKDEHGVALGDVNGKKWENGRTSRTKKTATTSVMAPDYTWTKTGDGSGTTNTYTHASYSASGSYLYDRVERDASVSGYENVTGRSDPEWTLTGGDTWTMTGGSGTTITNSMSKGSYSGDGEYTESSSSEADGVKRWSKITVNRSESGSHENRVNTTTESSFIDGAWAIVDGSASGSGFAKSHSSYTADGKYGYQGQDVTVKGTAGGEGDNSYDHKYETTANWDSAITFPGESGSGGWAMNGTATGDASSHSHNWSSGSGTLSRKSESTGRYTSETNGTISEDNDEANWESSHWDMTLSINLDKDDVSGPPADAWTLTGSDSASGTSESNFTLNASGTYWTAENSMFGETTELSERHDDMEWSSERHFGDDWEQTSGNGTTNGYAHDKKTRFATGNFALETEQGTYKGIRNETEDREYTFDSQTVLQLNDEEWTESGTATVTESGSASELETIANATYRRDVNDSVVTGGFYDFMTTESEYHFEGEHTLDFTDDPDGQWVLTAGEGSTYAGVGGGQAFNGSGTYSYESVEADEDFEALQYSISGKIEESGGWSITEGEGEGFNVSDGEWVSTGKSGSGTFSGFSKFKNESSGEYTHGEISGSFSRTQTHKSNTHLVHNLTGSGSGGDTHSGDGTKETTDTYDWEFSGDGDYTLDGISGTLTERGEGEWGRTEDFVLVQDSNGVWRDSSGVANEYDRGDNSASFSGTQTLSVTEAARSYVITNRLDTDERTSHDVSKEFGYITTGRAWYQTGGTESEEVDATYSLTKALEGTYSDSRPDSTMEGTFTYDALIDHVVHRETSDTFGDDDEPAGKGTDVITIFIDESLEGDGEYTSGVISGTQHEDGSNRVDVKLEKNYKLFGKTWKVQGSGSGTATGGSHYSFSGEGEYTKSAYGGSISGDRSEYGHANNSYESHSTWKLGVGEKWVLMSGDGSASGDGHVHEQSSADGSYSQARSWDLPVAGTASEGHNEDHYFDYEHNYHVNDAHEWVGTGSGSAWGTTSYHSQNAGGGSQSGGTTSAAGYSSYSSNWSEASGQSEQTQYLLTWEQDAEGAYTWNLDSTTSAAGSGAYSYYTEGQSEYLYNSGDYSGGNGDTERWYSDSHDSIGESYQWTYNAEYHETFAEGESTNWSAATASGTGSGYHDSYTYSSWEFNTVTTGTDFHYVGSDLDSSGEHAHDEYEVSDTWTKTVDAAGSGSQTGSLTNHVTGSYRDWGESNESWTDNWTEDGEPVSDSYSYSDSWDTTTPYDHTIGYAGFHDDWEQIGMGEAWGEFWGTPDPEQLYMPESGDFLIVPDVPEEIWEDPEEPGEPEPNPFANGPWYALADGEPGASLLYDLTEVIRKGDGGSTTFDYVESIKKDVGLHVESSPYQYWDDELLGEYVIRPLVGDEILTGLSDTELVLGTIAVSAVIVVGAIYLPEAVVLAAIKGAVVGGVVGAGIGAAYDVARQLDEGATWDTLDRGQIGKAAISGGVAGALVGGAMGAGQVLIPSFCGIQAALGVAGGLHSLNNAYENYQQGNYNTATLDLVLGVVAIATASKGGCFVAGAQVVRYVVEPGKAAPISSESEILANEDDAWDAEGLALAVGTLLVGLTSLSYALPSAQRDEKSTRRQQAGHLVGIGRHNELEPDRDDLEQPSPPRWDAMIDHLFTDSDDLDEIVYDGWSREAESPAAGTKWQLSSAVVGAAVKERPRAVESPSVSSSAAAVELAERRTATSKKSRPASQPRQARRRGANRRFAALLGAACLLLTGIYFFGALPGPTPDSVPVSPTAAAPRLVTSNIEDIRLGDWLQADNPELEETPPEASAAASPEQWRRLTLRMVKADGSLLDFEFLRSVEWLAQFDVQVGGTIDVELTELAASGEAEVLAIAPCPEIAPRPGPNCRLVTGRYVHESADALDLELVGDGWTESIGVTANHPFWSEDRRKFVPASDLLPGETLVTVTEKRVHVGSMAPRDGPERVYNLEVNVEHVYYVSSHGVLAHNATNFCGTGKNRPNAPRAQRRPPFKNDVFPEDTPVRVGRFELLKENGKWITRAPDGTTRSATGKYIFVKQNGRIFVQRDRLPNGHIDIARGQAVDYAGEIRFSGRNNRGILREWTNGSGHYQPPKEYAGDAGLPLNLFNPVD